VKANRIAANERFTGLVKLIGSQEIKVYTQKDFVIASGQVGTGVFRAPFDNPAEFYPHAHPSYNSGRFKDPFGKKVLWCWLQPMDAIEEYGRFRQLDIVPAGNRVKITVQGKQPGLVNFRVFVIYR
jgi:hypothetical protein